MVDIVEIYLRALKNYSEKIRKLNYDKDSPIDDIVKSDLNKEALDVEQLIHSMNKTGLYSDSKTGTKFTDYDNYRQLICLALKSYINDLDHSAKLVKGKLGIEDFNFDLTNKELDITGRIYAELCVKKTNKFV